MRGLTVRFERCAWVIAAALVSLGCPDEKPVAPSQSRFDGVASKALTDEKRFCDKTWPAGARPFQRPAIKPVEGAGATEPGKGWRWVNVWATWCAPCVDEMALLTRWKSAFEKDGLEVSFEMISIDEADALPTMKTWLGRLPGSLQWVQAPDDVPAWLERSVGISADSAIPIHVLVDPAGGQRCVRVGAVHAQDYGAVRAFLGAEATPK